MDLVGTKTLRATKASTGGSGGVGVLTVDSESFTITAASAGQRLFPTRPPNSVAGVAFSPQPVVTIRDAFGNTVTTGADATATVTLNLQRSEERRVGKESMNGGGGVEDLVGKG